MCLSDKLPGVAEAASLASYPLGVGMCLVSPLMAQQRRSHRALAFLVAIQRPHN